MAAKRKFMVEFFRDPGVCIKRNFASTRTKAIQATVGHFVDQSYSGARVADIYHVNEFGLSSFVCTVMFIGDKIIVTNL